MTNVVTINNECITAEYFIKYLKLSNEFPYLLDKLIRHKVTVHAAQKQGVKISTKEVQRAADDFRRYMGLHRARDTQEWLDQMGVDLDDFENYITEQIYKRKIIKKLANEEAIQAHFKLNAPQFDKVDIKHIVIQGEGKARELEMIFEEEPDSFDEMVQEHSLDFETKAAGGFIGAVTRGVLPDEIEAKVFHAQSGDILGPFQIDDDGLYEIIQIVAFHAAELDDEARAEISEMIYEQWLSDQISEHTVEQG